MLASPSRSTVLNASAVSFVAVLVSCSGRAAPTADESAHSGCTAGTGVAATSGVIEAGPFDSSLTSEMLLPDGGKFWVGTMAPGPRQGAVIRATLRDDPQVKVTKRYPTEPVATAEGELTQFYPGMLHLPQAGSWSLVISIGADTGCFELDLRP